MQQLTGNTVPNLPPPLQSGVPLPGVVNGNGVPQVRCGSPYDLSNNTSISTGRPGAGWLHSCTSTSGSSTAPVQTHSCRWCREADEAVQLSPASLLPGNHALDMIQRIIPPSLVTHRTTLRSSLTNRLRCLLMESKGKSFKFLCIVSTTISLSASYTLMPNCIIF